MRDADGGPYAQPAAEGRRTVQLPVWLVVTLVGLLVAVAAVTVLLSTGGDDGAAPSDGRGPADAELDGGTQSEYLDGAGFIVFMNPNATATEIDAVREDLEENPQVRELDFCDQQCAYDEFLVMFADDPALTENLSPDILPTSFRVKALDAEADAVEALAASYETLPGVREVAV